MDSNNLLLIRLDAGAEMRSTSKTIGADAGAPQALASLSGFSAVKLAEFFTIWNIVWIGYRTAKLLSREMPSRMENRNDLRNRRLAAASMGTLGQARKPHT